jgi:TatD DNase family protein
MLIDTHAHLDDLQFDADRDSVISRAFSSGVSKIINIGAGLGSSQRSVELAKKYENIFAAIGFHPHYFNEYQEKSFDKIDDLEKLAQEKKVVAIGEIGLDYHSHDEIKISEKEKDLQKKGFVFQLELARKIKKPVVLHCRGERTENGEKYRENSKAYEDIFEIIKNFSELEFVFHGFGGRLDFTKKILAEKNIRFAFNGNITYAKVDAEIFSVIKKIPIEKIMLETDCPYLAPVPMRGKRNEPFHVSYVGKKIAELKNLSLEEVHAVTSKTAENFFQI